MNKVLKILCCTACALAFCFLAIGYANVQDTLLVNGSVSVIPPNKVYAVYGEAFDSGGTSLGMALNFYSRPIVEVGDTITLYSDDGTMFYGTQNVTEVYTGFDKDVYTNSSGRAWSTQIGQQVVRISVIDEGITPKSTAFWFSDFTECTYFDLLKLDTSAVTNMYAMFSACHLVTELDLSSFNTSTVEDMRMMFSNCENLTTIVVTEDFVTDSVKEITDNVFSGCTQLKGGANTTVSDTGISYARIDGGSTAPGYFTYYKYSVVFEPNHKTLSGKVVATVPEKMLSKNNTFTIPAAPTHKWATFLGWSMTSTADETTPLYQPGNTFTSSTGEPCCDVLYAIWDLGIQSQTELEAAIANGDRLIIGGGTWSSWTPSVNNVENLVIEDGIFQGLMSINGSNTTINGGEFRGSLIWCENDSTFTINGGNFTASSMYFYNESNDPLTVNIHGGIFDWKSISFDSAATATTTITGGTFGFDPSSYVPDRCTVTNNGDGTWTVSDANAALANEE